MHKLLLNDDEYNLSNERAHLSFFFFVILIKLTLALIFTRLQYF